MRRRDVLAVAAVTSVAATPALAGPGGGGGEDASASLDLLGVGLPIIADGRIRNYVFVSLKLLLAPSADVTVARSKEPWLRDAIVRAAHRRPFVVPGDWTRMDSAALSDGLLRAARVLIGEDQVLGAEVVTQAPRRRTGMQGT